MLSNNFKEEEDKEIMSTTQQLRHAASKNFRKIMKAVITKALIKNIFIRKLYMAPNQRQY